MANTTEPTDLYSDPRAAADAAAEAVRALNHATLETSTLTPADVYTVLGALVEMLQSTPQAVGQPLHAVQRHHDADGLAHDSLPIAQVMSDVEDEAVHVNQFLEGARTALSTMHQSVSGISQR